MLLLAFAQDQQAVQASQGSPGTFMVIQFALIIAIFYFILFRPQKKAQQEHAKMLENLKKNDEIITSGGIHGTVVNIQNDVVTLRVDDSTRMKIQRSAVSKLKKSKEG